MKYKYRGNMPKWNRWIPNILLHIVLIFMIPVYIFVGVLFEGLNETVPQFIDEFFAWYTWDETKF